MEIQKQESGDNSSNIQINGNVTCGITYSEARQIALDVYKANCQALMSEAAHNAEMRVREIVDEFIKKLFEEIPELSNRLKEPSIQYSMFSVIKNYVKTGDVSLKERLLKMLIHRMEAKDRSLEQIVLDEAIEVLPKLTQDQIDILSLVFSAIYVNQKITSIDSFHEYINNRLMVFYPNQKSISTYNHLQYTGCCILLSEGATYKPFHEIIRNRYQGLFIKGFSKETLEQTLSTSVKQVSPIIITCQQNTALLQFNAMNESVLDDVVKKNGLDHLSGKIKQLHKQSEMTNEEITNYLFSINPKMKSFMEEWKGEWSSLKSIALTTVGYAIAILNFNIKTGENVSLKEYVK